ncbi:hypothetical protein ACQP1V_16115 [Microtetraspora malaysiensis]|uniref:hypothetical protein n=1 Tax=Microtetraspora malaysiensis TaxID=161358 RepID=UPI003D943F51
MILARVLEGLACAECEADGELWHDAVRGVVECRACGYRTVLGGEDGEGFGDGYDGADGWGWEAAAYGDA